MCILSILKHLQSFIALLKIMFFFFLHMSSGSKCTQMHWKCVFPQSVSEQKCAVSVNRHVPAQGGPGPVFWGKHHLMLGMLITADSRSLCPLDTEPKGTCNQICSFIGLAGSGQAVADEYVMC